MQPSKLNILANPSDGNLTMTFTRKHQAQNSTQYFRLTRISLGDNPVSEEEDLRIRLLIKINSLKVINKEEVTDDERLEVKELMQTQHEAED